MSEWGKWVKKKSGKGCKCRKRLQETRDEEWWENANRCMCWDTFRDTTDKERERDVKIDKQTQIYNRCTCGQSYKSSIIINKFDDSVAMAVMEIY